MAGKSNNLWTSSIVNTKFNRNDESIQPLEFVQILDSASNVFVCQILLNSVSKPDIKDNNSTAYVSKNKFVETPTNYTSVTKIIANMIKAIILPDVSFDSADQKRGGYLVKDAGYINIGDLQLTSYNDKDGKTYKFWENLTWNILHNNKNNKEQRTNYRLFPNEYKFDFIVWKLDRETGTKNLKYEFKGCWPKNVSGFNLDWDNTEAPPTFQIDLSVDSMQFYTWHEFSDMLNKSPLSNIENYALLYALNEKAYPYNGTSFSFNGSTYKNIFKESAKEKLSKDNVNNQFTRIKNDIKSRLKESGKILLNQTIKEFEEKVRSKLPAIFRTLDFRNTNNLLNQIYERIEGWTRGEISGARFFITQAELKEMLANLDNWPPTIYTDVNSKNDEELFKILMEFSPTVLKYNDDTTESIIKGNWNPTIIG